MSKYKKYFSEMISENKELFEQFQIIHQSYSLNPEINQDKFNQIGKDVLDVIREYERKLCRQQERGQFGKYSQNLSDKFWSVIRIYFPKIDRVGIKII
jgi:hypothetical protein